jgi:hypothetical protein
MEALMLVALLGGSADGLITALTVFALVLIFLTLTAEMKRRTQFRPLPQYSLTSPGCGVSDPIQTLNVPFYPTTHIGPGAIAPAGIYVVSHREPAHAVPHEVTIRAPMILPECNGCAGVHFSRKCDSPTPIEDCEFFQYL